MAGTAIRVESLSKQYRIGQAAGAGYQTLRDRITDAFKAPFRLLSTADGSRPTPHDPQTIWALSDVSFDVKAGEVIGIIGRNGAGKSTLLKILSRITEPTRGRATVNGRIGTLLEVGTGFHPELTGRENTYMNGAILGMRKTEIDAKFDEIIAFAEVEKFIDTPVKFYSSGMYVRLAFAVAAHLEPEVLIVDEVLAVGDAAFQKKCMGKMGDVAGAGRTVLLVSHNMAAVDSLCSRVAVLDQGRLAYLGTARDGIGTYLRLVGQASKNHSLRTRTDRRGNGQIRVVGAELKDRKGNLLTAVPSGSDVDLLLHYETGPGYQEDSILASLSILSQLGVTMVHFSNGMAGRDLRIAPGAGTIVCRLNRLPLWPATYKTHFSLRRPGNPFEFFDQLDDVIELNVLPGDFYGPSREMPEGYNYFLVEGSWELSDSRG